MIIITLWEFLTPALSGESQFVYEWQQVPTGLQDSSEYSER